MSENEKPSIEDLQKQLQDAVKADISQVEQEVNEVLRKHGAIIVPKVQVTFINNQPYVSYELTYQKIR